MGLNNLCLGVLVLSSAVIFCTGQKIGRRSGVPGEDFPTFSIIPSTSFKCTANKVGYYADVEALCQVFHICQEDGRHNSFLCPNSTLFNSKHLVCDWWYNVDCSASVQYPPKQVFQQRLSSDDSPTASTNNGAGIVPSTGHQHKTVTASTAREPEHHKIGTVGIYPANPPPPATNYSYGVKMPSVNRMGGVKTDLIQTSNFLSVTEKEIVADFTESPTTIQPSNEDIFSLNTNSPLSVGEQLAIIPAVIDANGFEIKEEEAGISSDLGVVSAQTVLSTDSQSDQEFAAPFEPILVENSAAVVSLNALSEKDLDDYVTTTPTLLAANPETLTERPAVTPDESTQHVPISSLTVTDDSIQSNLVTLETTTTTSPTTLANTFIHVPSVNQSSELLEPPAIVGLYFQVLDDLTPENNATAVLPVSAQLGPTPGFNFSGNTSTSNTTPSSAESIQNNHIIPLIPSKQPEDKRTLYEKLKPAILPGAAYGDKFPKTSNSKTTKLSIISK